jgi:hypothetical protein
MLLGWFLGVLEKVMVHIKRSRNSVIFMVNSRKRTHKDPRSENIGVAYKVRKNLLDDYVHGRMQRRFCLWKPYIVY